MPQSSPAEAAKKPRKTRATARQESWRRPAKSSSKLGGRFQGRPGGSRSSACYALAKAEAVLVGISEGREANRPVRSSAVTPTDRAATRPKRLNCSTKSPAATPDTDWGKDSKKLADALQEPEHRTNKSRCSRRACSVLPGRSSPKGPAGRRLANLAPGAPVILADRSGRRRHESGANEENRFLTPVLVLSTLSPVL